MLKNLKVLGIFYGKILIPTLLFSLLIALATNLSFKIFGLCFLLLFPLLHFFIYELRLKNQYLFYANFGFSRQFLWISTISMSLIINIITKFL
ncbi:hypothetical protein SAMN05444267_10402 [Chryseobacterium polytrichastri]|uniref:Uncharacterized protein n=1 Tax=Chryseobacterium polytrichastri TaxID=1302687 RepID=A0A1M7HC94_9FLAO|nr:hypothetical protein SAMN05444267_10402 [Chryseobacterium polytrichastri]